MQKQKEEWQPIIDWFCDRHLIDIQVSDSFSPPIFSANAREIVRKHLLSYSMDAIQGFTFGADAVKSLILMSAIVDKMLTVHQAVKLARLETNFQVGTST